MDGEMNDDMRGGRGREGNAQSAEDAATMTAPRTTERFVILF